METEFRISRSIFTDSYLNCSPALEELDEIGEFTAQHVYSSARTLNIRDGSGDEVTLRIREWPIRCPLSLQVRISKPGAFEAVGEVQAELGKNTGYGEQK